MATLKNKDERDFRLVSAQESPRPDFNKIRIGNKTLQDDVFLNTDYRKFYRKPRVRREDVERALENRDVLALRELSNY